jgi:hypothetical protein
VMLMSAAVVGLAWVAGFILGACGCEQTGFPHLDAMISYLRVHLFNRKAAVEVSQWFRALGVPITLTTPSEYAALGSMASFLFMKSARIIGRSRLSILS